MAVLKLTDFPGLRNAMDGVRIDERWVKEIPGGGGRQGAEREE